ncbi:MAG: GlsB/YeaQ/YmgE family stress response membrane protein [Eubacteriales bacterium]|nr:GlsB/YeaQ/YmgE family stress response membrane protein [Eubacteriales bacterium]
MNVLGWIVIGALAGWIASLVTRKSKDMGALMNVSVGIIGGVIGGFIMNLFGGSGITGFNLWSLLVATGGAIVLLLIVNAFKGKEEYN